MPSLTEALTSQVGRKFLSAITGILLLLFVINHLMGNLLIFAGPEALNRYSLWLHDFGWLLWVARIGLLIALIFHAWIGISIWWRRRKARPVGYSIYSSKGGPSKQGLSSRSMALTGVVLLGFLVIHLKTFAMGHPGTVMIDGREANDFFSLVIATFQDPIYAFGYAIVILMLGAHLGHGVWSAFTSLTVKSKKLSGVIYTIGVLLSILLAIGFIFIPLYIYFTGGEGALISG